MMVVSSEAATLGKLISLDQAAGGTYEIVARCEEINDSTGVLVFRTLSPTVTTY
jgi:hypothetical protein